MDIDNLVISQKDSINEALKYLDQSGKQLLLVVDQDKKFIGTVSDGDIRRGLLAGKTLNDPVGDITNTTPLTAKPQADLTAIINQAKSKKLTKIPIVDAYGRIHDLYEIDNSHSLAKNNAVIIMAGGLGTRLKPLTNDTPKPLLPIADSPILEIIIKHFCKHGFTRIYLAVNYKAEMIKNYFGNGELLGAEITYLEESERRGTAGALNLIDRDAIQSPFFVMNGDLLTLINLEQMLNYHLELRSAATIAVKEYDFQIPYGVVKTNNHYVSAIDEKPTYRFFVNAGIYILEPDALSLVPQKTFIDMPYFLELLCQKKRNVGSFPIHEYWMDIGQMEDYQKANDESNLFISQSLGAER